MAFLRNSDIDHSWLTAEEKVCAFQEQLDEEAAAGVRENQFRDVASGMVILRVLETLSLCSTRQSTVDLQGRVSLPAFVEAAWS